MLKVMSSGVVRRAWWCMLAYHPIRDLMLKVMSSGVVRIFVGYYILFLQWAGLGTRLVVVYVYL